MLRSLLRMSVLACLISFSVRQLFACGNGVAAVQGGCYQQQQFVQPVQAYRMQFVQPVQQYVQPVQQVQQYVQPVQQVQQYVQPVQYRQAFIQPVQMRSIAAHGAAIVQPVAVGTGTTIIQQRGLLGRKTTIIQR